MAQAESAITNPTGNESIGWEAYVWRAAVAGAVGSVVLLGLGVIYNWWWYSLRQLGGALAIAAIIAPFLGLMQGAAVGGTIWKIRKQMIAEPDAWFRFFIGMGVAALFELMPRTGVPRLASVLICLFLGGFPALAARPTKSQDSGHDHLNDDSSMKPDAVSRTVTQPADLIASG